MADQRRRLGTHPGTRAGTTQVAKCVYTNLHPMEASSPNTHEDPPGRR